MCCVVASQKKHVYNDKFNASEWKKWLRHPRPGSSSKPSFSQKSW